jgi:catalase
MEKKQLTTEAGRPVGDNQNSLTVGPRGPVDRHNHRLDNDYYTQPGNLFRLMTPDARKRLIGNIVASMKSVPQRIQELQIQHFYKADPDYERGVAEGLGLSVEAAQQLATATR